MQTFILQAEYLDRLIQAIRADGYQVLGPTLAERAIVYDEIRSADDLPRGWTDEQEKGYYRVKRREDDAYFGYAAGPHSWKKFLQLPRRPVWRAQKSIHPMQITAVVEEAPAMAFLGVRSCELHAIATQDRVFVDGRYQNDSYAERRGKLFIVAVNCTSAAATCFCTSMNTGPKVTLPNDLEMTEVIDGENHYFLLCSGSGKGERILRQLPLKRAGKRHREAERDSIQQAVKQMLEGPRSFDSSDLKELLYRNYESPAWDQVADRCLSCANCTMACPTCFCSTVEDTTDLSGEHAQRWERWDSCFTADFSYITGGPVRPDTRSRYRQWMTHKLATWYDQFGTSGCVGCGRCIAWCPVGIDITEEVQRIREAEKP
ncbi:4Fe-4S dicluster domain-containing protein [Microbulbifer rhizosphaerae]|uniref:Formate hydrogenlyase subunit 6/NADH:ubiquinone oxidoreductase subunit I n=1 Tax=Microbulbifer rhizosphaerae TaxID=1562603 RepID=A0A7W4W9U3_9GAMM|nr:4Fe-4S dicluster domain-containing protein [Microbulbifer rhizosphaerae]MBB3060114.1 formate hydrogenlyase subunit 6/NADH:ubiquinone oxidoreductase subunit I [Microbulbifer rhizosphaerae]